MRYSIISILIIFLVILVFMSGCTNSTVDPSSLSSVSDCERDNLGITDDQCYYNVARNTGNSEICDNIIKEDFKYKCLSEVLHSETLCKNIKDRGYRDGCYIWVARDKGDISICNNVEGEVFKKACPEEVTKAQ